MSASTDIPKPLTALAIAQLVRDITYLRYASLVGTRVVLDDGSIEKGGGGYLMRSLVSLTRGLETHGLCKSELPELKSQVAAFENKYVKGGHRKLDEADKKELTREMDRVEALFQETIRDRNFSETTPTTGLLDYRKLLADGLMGLFRDEKVVEALSPTVADDMSDAVRCLAFNIPTPSVMIALRATEGMLREIYALFTKKPPESWSKTSELLFSKLKEMQIDTAGIEGYLSHIRTIRNSAEHPEKRFNLKEAEDLLINSQYAIVELLKLRPLAPKP
jgi:hypothetical protein